MPSTRHAISETTQLSSPMPTTGARSPERSFGPFRGLLSDRGDCLAEDDTFKAYYKGDRGFGGERNGRHGRYGLNP